MIPDYQSCMRPALAHLADGQLHRSREVKDALADQFGLTEAERAELLPSGRQRVIDNRVGWALTYLSQAGLVDRPSRGHVKITESGQAVLARNPNRVDLKVLEQFPSYLEFRDRTREAKAGSNNPSVEHAAAEVSPEDLLATAVAENKAALEGELLKRALGLDPKGFELLVLRLLAAMGYGKSGAVEAPPASPATAASTESSAKTRSVWTGSISRRSSMRPTGPSAVRPCRLSPAR